MGNDDITGLGRGEFAKNGWRWVGRTAVAVDAE